VAKVVGLPMKFLAGARRYGAEQQRTGLSASRPTAQVIGDRHSLAEYRTTRPNDERRRRWMDTERHLGVIFVRRIVA
jgi:hypothetical protein